TFIRALDVSDEEMKVLRSARRDIRQAIRKRFDELGFALDQGRIFAGLEGIKASESTELRAIKPRFWPQGSSVYKTMNAPAQPPAQQIDIDDGVYLPMNVFDGRPVIGK